MKCEHVYTILDALERKQPFVADKEHIEYVIEKGLVRRLSLEQEKEWRKEVENLSELEEQLRYHENMSGKAQYEKAQKNQELDKFKGGWKKYFRWIESIQMNWCEKTRTVGNEVFSLETSTIFHKKEADRIKLNVELLKEMKKELGNKMETAYGTLCITKKGEKQCGMLAFENLNKDYETFEKAITAQTEPLAR